VARNPEINNLRTRTCEGPAPAGPHVRHRCFRTSRPHTNVNRAQSNNTRSRSPSDPTMHTSTLTSVAPTAGRLLTYRPRRPHHSTATATTISSPRLRALHPSPLHLPQRHVQHHGPPRQQPALRTLPLRQRPAVVRIATRTRTSDPIAAIKPRPQRFTPVSVERSSHRHRPYDHLHPPPAMTPRHYPPSAYPTSPTARCQLHPNSILLKLHLSRLTPISTHRGSRLSPRVVRHFGTGTIWDPRVP